MVVKDNQPSLAAAVVDARWPREPSCVTEDRGHGRVEVRTLRVKTVPRKSPLPGFPAARQVITVMRERFTLAGEPTGQPEISFAITSLSRTQASAAELAGLLRGHWCIENSLHYVRDVTYAEDMSRVRTGSGPRVMASLRNIAIAIHRLNGEKNIASAIRRCCQDSRRAFTRLCARTKTKAAAAA